jgi:energy-coupling factor transporter ATP-binding protein EcfA2
MPNTIKYSTTGDTLSLKKGNLFIGVGDVGKGPSTATQTYNGVSPVASGYTIYIYNPAQASNVSFYSANNDGELITFTNGIAGQTFTGVTQCLNWYATQTNYVCVNIDYESIVTNGLSLNLDAGFTPSYTSSGTTWYDLSYGGNNGTLTNGPTFNSNNGGSIVFDGVDDYINNIGTVNDYNFIFSAGTFSVSFWMKKAANNTRYTIAGNTLTNSEKGYTIILEYGISGFGDNCLRFSVVGNAVNTRLIAGSTADNTMTSTDWAHCAFTCQNPDKIGQWYINGVASTTTTRVGSGNANQGTYYSGPAVRTLNVGRSNWTSTLLPFNGNISQFSIYNRALSATEVLQNYNAQKSRFGL